VHCWRRSAQGWVDRTLWRAGCMISLNLPLPPVWGIEDDDARRHDQFKI
jgi:hypothetical protein